jgi:hypothetical protein
MIARTCPAWTSGAGFLGLLLVGVRFAVAFAILALGTVAIKAGPLGGLLPIVHFLRVALNAPARRVHTLACRILRLAFLAAAAGKPVRTSVVVGPLALIWRARRCFFPSDSGHRLVSRSIVTTI